LFLHLFTDHHADTIKFHAVFTLFQPVSAFPRKWFEDVNGILATQDILRKDLPHLDKILEPFSVASLRFVSTGCGNAPRKSSDTSLNQIAMQILLVEGNYIYLQDVTTLTAISSHVSLTRQGLA